MTALALPPLLPSRRPAMTRCSRPEVLCPWPTRACWRCGTPGVLRSRCPLCRLLNPAAPCPFHQQRWLAGGGWLVVVDQLARSFITVRVIWRRGARRG